MPQMEAEFAQLNRDYDIHRKNYEELVARRYLRALPLDPVTGAADTWVAVAPPPPEAGKVYDVKSGSAANARDGTPFSSW